MQSLRVLCLYDILLYDTNCFLTSDYCIVKAIGAGQDAEEIALITLCQFGDLVLLRISQVGSII